MILIISRCPDSQRVHQMKFQKHQQSDFMDACLVRVSFQCFIPRNVTVIPSRCKKLNHACIGRSSRTGKLASVKVGSRRAGSRNDIRIPDHTLSTLLPPSTAKEARRSSLEVLLKTKDVNSERAAYEASKLSAAKGSGQIAT